ncbi:ABC-type transport system involved in multi-copper enzyme maturation, permease component [Asanoa hainanensis]|uniref:ABC-type transport system involved in multi-copper enzyme maturation, permease component n=1 Tax=Asanoa hainanensis TaxID=560556 RepID=A0A239GDB6_9ACTN|nr:ABC transporter permease subunit [Asanoa hainanensis]SNS67316.1 ABC-type transport system involved in multi-copper enzyme maturation, permease component [Asanoa hainanensis]
MIGLVRAELTKFRSVRGWLVGCGIAVVLMVLLAVVAAAGTDARVGGPGARAELPRASDGTPVLDGFTFLQQPLAGDGTLTVRVASLTGVALRPPTPDEPVPTEREEATPEPWAKAGLIIKDGTTPGSPYAAVMVTGSHGVRLQHDFIHDLAGPADARWLRLVRRGGTVTAYASTDGAAWTTVGSAPLATGEMSAGIFVATPPHQEYEQFVGGTSVVGGGAIATGTFDNLTGPGGDWTMVDVGADDSPNRPEGTSTRTGDTFVLRGGGDIAPVDGGTGPKLEQTLSGGFLALTVLAVLGVLFVTTEYRRGMVRTTFAATPSRVRVLAAKSVVLGGVTFAVGLVAATAALLVGTAIRGDNAYPADALTQVRIVVGTAALIAVATVLALAIGTILRRGAGAVAAVVVLITLPYILSAAAVLPAATADWVLRITPAAAFAVQQTVPEWPQVDQAYTPAFGFFPLPAWGGFAVLCAWTALALAIAAALLRRRDA